jgi:ABC-type Fe3+-citrate transport system substrate-binding protein
VNISTAIATGALLALLISGCSSMEGQVGKKVETFTDDHGRVCTSVKWGDSASVDCDWPQ